jgi:hypothetical protein
MPTQELGLPHSSVRHTRALEYSRCRKPVFAEERDCVKKHMRNIRKVCCNSVAWVASRSVQCLRLIRAIEEYKCTQKSVHWVIVIY